MYHALLTDPVPGQRHGSAGGAVSRRAWAGKNAAEIATLVSSFDHAALFDFRRLDALTPVAPLLSRWRGDIFDTAAALGAETVNLSQRCATARHIASLADAGYAVLVYTVNDVDAARRLKRLGVRGVCSDYPDRLMSLADP